MQFSTYATPSHLAAARNYLTASNFLLSAPNAREPNSPFSAPANYLVAHGAELTLKAYLSWFGMSDADVEDLRHNIAKAFQEIKSRNNALISAVEKHVGSNWRHYLKEARCVEVAAFEDYEISSQEILASLGIASNEDIGNQHPTFARNLNWLSDRHISIGGSFRYVRFGLDSVPYIDAFGLNECTVPRTILWGCEYVLNILEHEIRKQQT